MSERQRKGVRKALKVSVIAVLTTVGVAACAHVGMMMGGHGHEKPAETEFGFGPRLSSGGLYSATLDPVQPIRVRRMQTMRVQVSDATGRPIEGAAITVDGGMPQHGHGLPTQPKVTRSLGYGVYEVEGVKFNMGGWWEVKFAIAGEAGADTVTFNLDL